MSTTKSEREKYVIFIAVDILDESNSDDSSTDTKHKKYRLADFFTMRCDLCDDVQFSTFQNAKQHYRTVHEIKGYLMCCDKKFMKPRTIDDHLRWHTNPLEHLKYDLVHKSTKDFALKIFFFVFFFQMSILWKMFH